MLKKGILESILLISLDMASKLAWGKYFTMVRLDIEHE